jgi:subtilisin family serine protease
MSRRTISGVLTSSLAAGSCLALLLLPALPGAQAQRGRTQSGFGPSRYIIVLKESAGEVADAAREVAQAHRLSPGLLYRRVLRGFVATVPPSRLAALMRDPRVAYVERDQRLRAFASFPVTPGVDRIGADASATAKIDGTDDRVDIDIAVIDSGIQRDHPDLNVVGGRNFVTSGASNDQWDDLNGHGTHVAGTIAAKDDGPNQDGIHVVGVAPGARLWAVRVLDSDGSCFASWVIAGIEWVTDLSQHPPIPVANMSLGGNNSQALKDAVAASVLSGVTYVVAAGNDAKSCENVSPANSTSSGVITVSAIADYDGQGGGLSTRKTSGGKDDTFASFSNYGVGSAGVDISAPGVSILSTYPGSTYRRLDGTSMAAPHVTGAAALYIRRSGGSPTDVRSNLLAAAKYADTEEGYSGGSKDSFDEPVLYAGGF